MYLKLLSGKIIFESRHHIIGDAIKEAIKRNISLHSIFLKKKKICHEIYQDISFDKASFWGSCLYHNKFINCSLKSVDYRLCTIKNSIFKNCSLVNADFRGVCLKHITFVQCDLSFCKFNDPNMFKYSQLMRQKLLGARYYSPDGEEHIIHTPDYNFKAIA